MIQPESTDSRYSCYDDGSAELEVLEFLKAFVKLQKPEKIFETGCYKGWSSTYMAKGLKENSNGHLVTLEIESQHISTAKERWIKHGVTDYITVNQTPSLDFKTNDKFELMFLDSEPNLRFRELVRFYNNLKEGGYVFIHDFPNGLCQGNINSDHPDFKHWPIGEIPEFIKSKVINGDLNVWHFPTPRGLIGFYRKQKDDYKWR